MLKRENTEDIPGSYIGRINNGKMSILPKLYTESIQYPSKFPLPEFI